MRQVVVFIGTVAASEVVAPLLAGTGVVPALVALMGAKRSDDELLLHLAFAVLRLLGQPTTQEQLLGDAQVGGGPGGAEGRGGELQQGGCSGAEGWSAGGWGGLQGG
jgi:hypothetical protein